MSEARPVEVTTRYATSVEDLASAWAFVMARLDSVGPDPDVSITPVWTISADLDPDEDPPRRFSVVVSGMVHEEDPDA